MAVRRYFLGANTAKGFFSVYEDFCKPDSGNFLYVIKGGPGCGKSSFMKKIGKAAEDAGLDVEYVLCSADPDSQARGAGNRSRPFLPFLREKFSPPLDNFPGFSYTIF